MLKFRISRINKFRFKKVRDENWVCSKCILAQFPYSCLNDKEFDIISGPLKKSVLLPSPDVLNSLFTDSERYPTEASNDHHDQEIYMYSDDVHELTYNIFKGHPNIDFPILSLNIRSIKSSKMFTKFEGFLSSLSTRPMLIALSETWISDTTKGPFRKIKGYQFIDNNRKLTVGGGVAFYVCNSLTCEKLDKFTKMEEKVFESLFIKVTTNLNRKLVFGTIYRSPNSSNAANEKFIGLLNPILKGVNALKDPCVIMGDFNYDLLKVTDDKVSKFTECFFDNSFYSLINIPTRITNNTITVLDHFWTNTFDIPMRKAVLLDQISDHLPTYLNLAISSGEELTIRESKIRIFCHFLY